jgi:hypothetical protein
MIISEEALSDHVLHLMSDASLYQDYINYQLKNLKLAGIDSQNVLKKTDAFTDSQLLWIHKLIFACEDMVKVDTFRDLEHARVELVCEKYSDSNIRERKIDSLLHD